MRNVKVVVSCDHCNGDVEEKDVKVIPLTWGKKTVNNDICPECQDEIKDLLSHLFANGRKPDSEITLLSCDAPGCTRTFESQQALSMHKTRTHKKKPSSPVRGAGGKKRGRT